MSSLLIFEPHGEGHHLWYVRWISREAVARGYEVWLAISPGCLEHPAYLALREECEGHLRTVTLREDTPKPRPQGLADSARWQIRYRRLFGEWYRRLSRNERPDYVFIPYLDYCTYAMALLGSPFQNTPWGGLVITPAFHLKKEGIRVPDSRFHLARERAFLRLLCNESLRVVFTFDETLIRHVRRSRPELAKRIRFLPEPAELHGSHSRESARQDLGVPSDATVILVYGVLDFTKGIDALLAATKDERFPGAASILLAGPQDDEVRMLLSSPRARMLRETGRLYEIDRFVYGEDEHAVFQAADMAWVGYRRQYISSEVLIQAAMAGLPVVACDEGLIGWLTRWHGLGLTVRVDDARAVAGAISRLARDRKLSAKFGENGKRFSAAHEVACFRRAIGEELLINFPNFPTKTEDARQ